MKKILIIGRKNVGEKNNAFLLAKVISQRSEGLIVDAVYFEDIVLSVTPTSATATFTDGSITDYQTVVMINWSHDRLYTDVAHSLALIADRAGIAVWNKELVTARSSTKISQLVTLSGHQIPFPHTLFSLTDTILEGYSDQVGSPFIAKDPLASRGRNNFLCDDWGAFLRQIDGSTTHYLLQDFIPNDKTDLRLFVSGGRVELAIMRRGGGNTHLNNISQGGQAELVPLETLPETLMTQAELVAKLFERELCGIDFMKNQATGEYSFLEINTTPQIVNGAFVDEKAAALARSLERM